MTRMRLACGNLFVNYAKWEDYMRQQHTTLRARLGKYRGPAILATAALLLSGNVAFAQQQGNDRAVRLLTNGIIPVPVSPDNTTAGALYSFDISWVDQETQLYYLADRSNKRVDIVDANTGTFITQISASPSFKGFTGNNDTSGPDGVVTGAQGRCLFVTDAPSRVVSFLVDTTSSPPTFTQVSDVSTASGDNNRTDELAFEPDFLANTGLIFAINNADDPPFGTFIKVNQTSCALTQPTAPPPGVAAPDRIILTAASGGVEATNGAEQPVWEPITKRFFLSIPEIDHITSRGAVVRIVPNTTLVETVSVVEFCSPAGLTVGPQRDLFIGCNKVFDTAGNVWAPNGSVTAAPKDVILHPDGTTTDVLGVGAGDEVWFNKGDRNYYATGSGSPFRPVDTGGAADAKGSTPLGVVDSTNQAVLQQVTTYNVPAGTGHPAGSAHSVAANAANNFIFVPLGANNAFSAFAVPNGGPVPDCRTGCIAVFGHPDED